MKTKDRIIMMAVEEVVTNNSLPEKHDNFFVLVEQYARYVIVLNKEDVIAFIDNLIELLQKMKKSIL